MNQADISSNFIDNPASEVIMRLPRIGNLMIIGKGNGATHERIGQVQNVTTTGDETLCSGACHDSRIHHGLISKITVDLSSVMAGQTYPRLDFRNADGTPIFAVVGFGGLEPFEAALEGLNLRPDPLPPTRLSRPTRADVAADDPGFQPLQAALASGLPVTIAFDDLGFSQSWSGVIEKVSPAMGFINVMTPDFHLHLLGGTVACWHTEGGAAIALDADGRPTGLRVLS